MSNYDSTERWEPIAEAPSYSISSHGRVARIAGGQGARPLLRKQDVESTGYVRVRLSENGIRLRLSVHRLVALAFLGPPPTKKHQVAHYDGVKTNNRAENLRWATCKENMADKQRHGSQARGETQGRSKVTEEDVFAIRSSGDTYYALAARYGISRNTVYRIRKRLNWAHV